MRKLLAGLPPYMRRNAEVHLAWIIIALFVAMITSGCYDVRERPPEAKGVEREAVAPGVYYVHVPGKVQCILLYDNGVACDWAVKP